MYKHFNSVKKQDPFWSLSFLLKPPLEYLQKAPKYIRYTYKTKINEIDYIEKTTYKTRGGDLFFDSLNNFCTNLH